MFVKGRSFIYFMNGRRWVVFFFVERCNDAVASGTWEETVAAVESNRMAVAWPRGEISPP